METLHLQSSGTKETTTVVNRYIEEKRGNLISPRPVIVGYIPVGRIILSGSLQPLWYSKLVSEMEEKIYLNFQGLFTWTRPAHEQALFVIFLDFHSTKQGLPLVDSWSRDLD